MTRRWERGCTPLEHFGPITLVYVPLPVTTQQFASDLDAAKAYFNAAVAESDPDKQRTFAMLALAAAGIAQAEALWLSSTSR